MNPKEIKKIRQDILKFSQEEFAQLLSVSTKTISRWESGESKPIGTTLQNLLNLQAVVNDKDAFNTFKKILKGVAGIPIGAVILAPLASIATLTTTVFGPSVIKALSDLIRKKK